MNISDPVTAQFPKPGTYGPTAGRAVDQRRGEVFMVATTPAHGPVRRHRVA